MSDAESRQFVDTNVLVYAHDVSAAEKHARARGLVRDLWRTGVGCLSVQVLQELYVTATGKLPHPLPPSEARNLIRDLATWHVHRPSAHDVVDAARVAERYEIAFWDAMVLHSARQLGCALLWSEDLNAGQVYGTVEVVNPFA